LGESEAHLALVRLLLDYVTMRFIGHGGVAIFADLPTSTRETRPPRVGGFVPDVYVTDVPATWVLIGEAKTEHDLLLRHTTAQLRAFLDLLRYHHGIFALAVPWSSQVTARQIVDAIVATDGITGVETLILAGPVPCR
jgi:hypothetical protein